MAFSLFQSSKKAKAAEVNDNFFFIAGERIIAINSSTGAAYGTFDLGDLTAISNGSLVGDLLAREGKSLKIYNSSGSLVQQTAYTDLISPAGMVAAFAMSTEPTGWLECDGSAISRSTYSLLFAQIGTTWGVGDGSTTFNIPDLRGEFIRGWDNGKGTDSGRSFASSQSDEVISHKHDLLYRIDSSTSGATPNNAIGVSSRTDTAYIDNNMGNYGGSETRPRNMALMYCIKY